MTFSNGMAGVKKNKHVQIHGVWTLIMVFGMNVGGKHIDPTPTPQQNNNNKTPKNTTIAYSDCLHQKWNSIPHAVIEAID